MKKLLLLTSAIALAAATAAAAPVTMQDVHKTRAERFKAAAKAPQSKELWRAGTEKTFDWTGGSWEPTSVITYTYDSEGRVLTNLTSPADGNEWDGYTRVTNTYNADGMVVRKLTEVSADGNVWTESEIVERKYDPVVKNLIIENRQGFWTGNEWNFNGNTYRRIVERNAAGAITLVEVQTLYLGGYEGVQRFTAKYGADGRAIEVEESVLTLDQSGMPVWGDGERYADIKWERTDGQLTSISDLTSINNRIKSATYWSEGERIGPVTATYPDEKGSYVLTLELPGIKSTEDVRVLDDNGSVDYNLTSVMAGGASQTTTQKYHYDAYGLETLIYASETEDGVEEIMGWLKGEVVYDQATGYPLELTVSTYEEGEWILLGHSIFEDYVDVAAGIEGVVADPADTAVTYYDLRGMRVDEPAAAGIYIRRQGGKTQKVIVR